MSIPLLRGTCVTQQLKKKNAARKVAHQLRKMYFQAAAANKRLKDALQKRSEVAEKRKDVQKRGMESVATRVKVMNLCFLELLCGYKSICIQLHRLLYASWPAPCF